MHHNRFGGNGFVRAICQKVVPLLTSKPGKMLAKILATNCMQVALVHVNDVKRQVPKLAKWGLPLVIGGGWFIYPALTKNFKSGLGLP